MDSNWSIYLRCEFACIRFACIHRPWANIRSQSLCDRLFPSIHWRHSMRKRFKFLDLRDKIYSRNRTKKFDAKVVWTFSVFAFQRRCKSIGSFEKRKDDFSFFLRNLCNWNGKVSGANGFVLCTRSKFVSCLIASRARALINCIIYATSNRTNRTKHWPTCVWSIFSLPNGNLTRNFTNYLSADRQSLILLHDAFELCRAQIFPCNCDCVRDSIWPRHRHTARHTTRQYIAIDRPDQTGPDAHSCGAGLVKLHLNIFNFIGRTVAHSILPFGHGFRGDYDRPST